MDLLQLISRAPKRRWAFHLRPPATPDDLAACERALGHSLPKQLRELLVITNGCALFCTPNDKPRSSGLHIWETHGEYQLPWEQEHFRTHPQAPGRMVWAYTPGTGAHELAIDLSNGEVLDCFAAPHDPWPVIGGSLNEFLEEMFRHLDQPLFWI